ncbi:hypothetical protein C2869_11250 [Saccharobesus litoralis]|uniref:Lipoprotein n=1 Tax=Saccharobesus litoralis TaxID=2172099 RepID=A0A2S0VRZ1_9ALTE|nr:hypothetical protein [Saccharobesus litoralis]AWB66977.1 hypothetical protein C2869_11250 [Saccharobesus litoralis]
MLKFICQVLLIPLALLSCNSTQQNNQVTNPILVTEKAPPKPLPVIPSNYDKDLKFPDQTASLVMLERHTYEEPLLGASIRYENRYYDEDEIAIYTYPIRHFSWQHNRYLLSSEMRNIFSEIDNAVAQGLYQKREGKEVSVYQFYWHGKQYSGLKAKTKIYLLSGLEYTSYSYLFVQKDKFIKFRISQPNANNLAAPDNLVREILPYIDVPSESNYMSKLRELHRKEYEKSLGIMSM